MDYTISNPPEPPVLSPFCDLAGYPAANTSPSYFSQNYTTHAEVEAWQELLPHNDQHMPPYTQGESTVGLLGAQPRPSRFAGVGHMDQWKPSSSLLSRSTSAPREFPSRKRTPKRSPQAESFPQSGYNDQRDSPTLTISEARTAQSASSFFMSLKSRITRGSRKSKGRLPQPMWRADPGYMNQRNSLAVEVPVRRPRSSNDVHFYASSPLLQGDEPQQIHHFIPQNQISLPYSESPYMNQWDSLAAEPRGSQW